MVTGKINLTCDAWQASNTDGYFVVTGHWVEEIVPTQWEIKTALLASHTSAMHTMLYDWLMPCSKLPNALAWNIR